MVEFSLAKDRNRGTDFALKRINYKVEKPIFMNLHGPKALDDKGREGTQRTSKNVVQKTCKLCNFNTDLAHAKTRSRVGIIPL
jgi:hypothetical protein